MRMENKVSFPDSWFEDEVRDGFYVPTMMKRAWAAQMEVLMEVADVCERHGLSYYADAGTLLGAVRHGGFVPWDDDLDICMKRQDYEQFLKIAKKELPAEYYLLNIHTNPEFDMMFTRILNWTSTNYEEEKLQKYHGFPFMAGLDIFPLDDIIPDEETERSRTETLRRMEAVADQLEHIGRDVLEGYLRDIERVSGGVIDRSGNLKNQLYLQMDRLLARFCSEEAEEIAVLSVWASKGGSRYKKKWFQNTVKLPFETIEISVPAEYDAVLRSKYGDYMKIVQGSAAHEYPFYKKYITDLFEKHGMAWEPRYCFSPEDLRREEGRAKQTVKERVRETIGLMDKAHSAIRNGEKAGDLMGLMELLQLCQDCAISVGTLIEQSLGEGFVTVGMLEEYCELAWRMYEGVVGQTIGNLESACAALDHQLMRIADSVERDIKMPREIVFLPYKASMWGSFDSLWRAAKEDPDCNVYVIPIPYYSRNLDGSSKTMYYEGDQYPKDVPVTRFEEYDFAKRQPDVIFIHNPYDEYNSAVSVHPFFYSRNLRQYTSQLIYIPYFTLAENYLDDKYTLHHMESFVTVPGVVHADRVMVQSENMRKAYINCLSRFAGEDTRDVWEKKILGLGSLKYEGMKNAGKGSLDIPEAWQRVTRKADGTWKKVIVYGTSISVFLQYEMRMIGKLEQVLQIFEDNRDEVALVWKPDPLLREKMPFMEPQLWDAYQRIVKRYRADGWGIYDDFADAHLVVKLCDAYYGDASSLVRRFVEAQKPVMLQNI